MALRRRFIEVNRSGAWAWLLGADTHGHVRGALYKPVRGGSQGGQMKVTDSEEV